MAADQQIPQQPSAPSNDAVNTRNAELFRSKGPLPYGYHNSFHTHATDAVPPSYNEAKFALPQHLEQESECLPLPPYSCSVEKSSVISLMIEFRDPFMEIPSDRVWQKVYATLRGTQLSVHWVKSQLGSRKQIPKPGKKVAQFSLQHAEVGLAVDVRPEGESPKSAVINMLPSHLKDKLRKTKPHLFETHKEWLIRLRVEGYQLLMSFDAEEEMLDWCEKLCEAIDISAPLEDRTEPRYRSLPRRSRRQRQLENYFREDPSSVNMESLSTRIVEQQERILQTFYPNLASRSSNMRTSTPAGPREDTPNERRGADADMDEFDAADVAELRENIAADLSTNENPGEVDNHDPKTRALPQPASQESDLRYRRRCMPILYRYSPRSSEIVFYKDARWRIDNKKGLLRPFEMSPPRYPRGKKGIVLEIPSHLRLRPGAINTLRHRSSRTTQEDDTFATYRTTSHSSGRADETDLNSVHSAAGLTISSGNDGIEPVSTRASLGPLNTRDEIAEAPISPGISMLALKEKTTPVLERRGVAHNANDDMVHAFAGLVL